MNKISGRVVHKETNLGIPDLIVSLHERSLPAQPPQPSPTKVVIEDRLGSVATDQSGAFVLTYEDTELRARSEGKRADLCLRVSAPEEPDAEPAILFEPPLRPRAGRTEQFIVRLSSEQLAKAGLSIPSPTIQKAPARPEDPDFVIGRLTEAAERKAKLQDGLKKITAKRAARKQTNATQFDQNLRQPLLSSLSRVPVSMRNSANYVGPDEEDVEAKTLAVISSNIDILVNATGRETRPPVSTHVHLKPDQIEKLKSLGFEARDGGLELKKVKPDKIPVVDQELGLSGAGTANSLLRQYPIELVCREISPDEKSAEEALGLLTPGCGGEVPGTTPPGEVTGSGVATVTPGDVPKYIAALIGKVSPPEEQVVFSAPTRPGQSSVQSSVDAFALRRSPADVPAYYDFHSLQIAFEHVWQEAIDAGVLAAAKEAYSQIVELSGEEPGEGFRTIEGAVVAPSAFMAAFNQEPPPDVIKMFGVTKELWNVLDANLQASLEELAAVGMAQLDADAPIISLEMWLRVGDGDQHQGNGGDLCLYLSKNRHAHTNVTLLGPFIAGAADNYRRFQPPPDVRYVRDIDDITISTFGGDSSWYMSAFRIVVNGLTRYQNQSPNKLFSAENPQWTAPDFAGIPLTISWREMGERILNYGRAKLASSIDDLTLLNKLVRELEDRLKEPYAFTIYAANRRERSINFGVLTTYRQKWNPLNYQAGRLVKTVPLLPKEVRKFSKKSLIKKSRAEKEVENSLRVRKDETAATSRAESEIVRKARSDTNFNLTAQGSFNIGIASGSTTTTFGTQAEKSSDETKKEFREAVLKASEEYKQERTVEVNTSLSEDTEAEESGEISNPNDEIPVTFLFYELQRRYLVSQRIHSATPVILVAQEFPNPAEIDEDWLVTHDWILRRVILDDSFLPALSYLSTRVAGDEVALRELRKNLEDQRALVNTLQGQLVQIREQVGRRYTALESAIDKRIGSIEEEGSEGTGQDAAGDAWEQAAREERDLRAKIEREVTTLNALTESFTKALSDHLNRKTQINRLRVHVKQNIFYYMQAIWSHEPPDQRFFRLHKVRVPLFRPREKLYRLSLEPIKGHLTGVVHRERPTYRLDLGIEMQPPSFAEPEPEHEPNFTTLAEAANLDQLLGFKGNYMIFPLKEPNALTDFMLAPYRNGALGLQDPDEFGNWTIDEFAKYVCCLKKRMPKDKFDAIREELAAQYQRLAGDPRSIPDEVVVPTGSLFIEALPGAHPILEDFKLAHRAIDVKKVQAEVRAAELENLRAAARLLAGEREDKDIEKKIVVEGGQGVVVAAGDQ